MRAIPIYRYMTPNPHTIGRDRALSLAQELMNRHRIRHLPVLDEGVLVGILSDRDVRLVETMGDVTAGARLVEDAMTPEPYFVAADAPLGDVVRHMAEHKYGAAVILDRGNVIGVFSAVDGLRALAELLAAPGAPAAHREPDEPDELGAPATTR